MIYSSIISPILDRLDSEKMHEFARDTLHFAESNGIIRGLIPYLATAGPRLVSDRLRTSLCGIELENPVMVGAGWDKAGVSVSGLYQLGFSGVEVGSVLEFPQPGNEKPRQFMIGPGVSIQWLGFNSPGMEQVAKNLLAYRDSKIPIGINIGKNKDVVEEDAPRAYAVVAERLYHDASYFVVNVSSPNTPGLRKLQDRSALSAIIDAVSEAINRCGNRKPCFVKVSPELTFEALDDVIDVVLEKKWDGIVTINTSNNPELKKRYGERWNSLLGGLGGADPEYQRIGTASVRHIYQQTKGKLTVIGIGGVHDGKSALERLQAGASVVQVVTGIRGEGPAVAKKINRELLAWMDREGVKSIREIVGQDLSSANPKAGEQPSSGIGL